MLYEAFDVIRSNVSDVIRNALFFNKKNRGYNLGTIVEKASTDIAMYVIWKSVLDVANDNSLDDTISYAVKYVIRRIHLKKFSNSMK